MIEFCYSKTNSQTVVTLAIIAGMASAEFLSSYCRNNNSPIVVELNRQCPTINDIVCDNANPEPPQKTSLDDPLSQIYFGTSTHSSSSTASGMKTSSTTTL